MRDFKVRPPNDDQEVDGLLELLIESFQFDRELIAKWREIVGRENMRIVLDGARVVAGLAILEVRQWFGGQRLPMGAIAAVGVAPDRRGSGVGAGLMKATLSELRERKIPLSVLYASTMRLYRKVGYEQAGTAVRYSIPAADLPARERDLAVSPLDLGDPADLEIMKSLRREAGRAQNGYLERNDAMWGYLTRVFSTAPRAYLAGSRENPEGFVFFRQTGVPGGLKLELRDLVATTPRALQRLFTFLAGHRSLVTEVHFDGPPSDPRLLLLPEQTFKIEKVERFMVRVVDVPAALTGRGYPAHLDETLAFHLDDPTVPENTGSWTLRVKDGKGSVEPGGRAGLDVDVRTFAPLYTGLHPATALARVGKLTGSEEALAAADRIFGGQEPSMTDHF
jgi:predicted acetyltransferase